MGGVWRIVQNGAGATRPLVVCYFIGIHLDPKIRHVVHPNAAIINLTTEPGDGAYNQPTKLNPPLAQLTAEWSAKLGCTLGPVVLIGWSRGCQALRTQLRQADYAKPATLPDAVIGLDGIHSSHDPPWWQINTWKKWFVHGCGATLGPAGLGKSEVPHDRIMVATFSQIDPGQYRSVRATLEDVTGWNMPPGDAPGGAIPYPGIPGLYYSGGVQCWSWPGTSAKDHAWQQNFLAPFHLYDVCARLGFPGQPPASPPGPIEGPPGVELKTTPPAAEGMTGARIAAVSIPAALCGLYLYWSQRT